MCTHTHIGKTMATKTLSIKDNVYNKLLDAKEADESFSDVIDRLVSRKTSLSDSFGKWKISEKEIKKIKKETNEPWKEFEKEVK